MQVRVHGTRQHDLLEVAALADHVLDRVLVAHRGHVLRDDRAGIEVGRHVVAGRADHLHAAGVGRVIRLAAGEGGQERVVDVDHVAAQRLDERRRHDLHVAREHHEVRADLAQQLESGVRSASALVAAVTGTCSKRMPWRCATGSRSRWLLTISGMSTCHSPDSQRDSRSYRQWLYLRDEDRHPCAAARALEAPGHRVRGGDLRRERLLEVLDGTRVGRRGRPRHAHEEHVALAVDVLVEVHHVAVVAADQRGDRGDEAFAVGAVDEQDVFFVHVRRVAGPHPNPLPQGGRGDKTLTLTLSRKAGEGTGG